MVGYRPISSLPKGIKLFEIKDLTEPNQKRALANVDSYHEERFLDRVDNHHTEILLGHIHKRINDPYRVRRLRRLPKVTTKMVESNLMHFLEDGTYVYYVNTNN